MRQSLQFIDQNEKTDLCDIKSVKKIMSKLEKGEEIQFSCKIDKFNRKLKRQERTFVLTNQAIYNIKGHSVQRKILLTKLNGISISRTGTEFVLHVPEEYDYRYSSLEYRDKIVELIKKLQKSELKLFQNDEYHLQSVVTTRVDKSKNISKMPNNPIEILKPFLDQFNKRDSMGSSATLSHFQIVKVIGRGTFGKVMVVENKSNKRLYAMKSIRKQDILDPEALEHTMIERKILEMVSCPFLVKLEYAFQTEDKIFFVMPFMKGGEMFQHLRSSKKFPEPRAKFYAAEISVALHHLHQKSILYRDLKPENILLDDLGHICITDFGMCKILSPHEQMTNSFVGTAEYLAPEIINGEGHSYPCDVWSLGVFLFEMLYGIPPFYSKNQNMMFQMIKLKELAFPPEPPVTPEAKDLIAKMLDKNQFSRIRLQQIFKHAWFSDTDWEQLAAKKMPAPFLPKCEGTNWEIYFDSEFTNEDPVVSYVPNNELVDIMKDEFTGITYNHPEIQTGNNTPSNLPASQNFG